MMLIQSQRNDSDDDDFLELIASCKWKKKHCIVFPWKLEVCQNIQSGTFYFMMLKHLGEVFPPPFIDLI